MKFPRQEASAPGEQRLAISRLDAPAITAVELRASYPRSATRHREFSYLLAVLERPVPDRLQPVPGYGFIVEP